MLEVDGMVLMAVVRGERSHRTELVGGTSNNDDSADLACYGGRLCIEEEVKESDRANKSLAQK